MRAELINDRKMTEWQLFHLAQALTRARRLEKYREEFHEELYDAIQYPSVQFGHEYEPSDSVGSPATDTQAIRIIEAKERYDKKIQGEYDRHVRWQQLLEWADDNDRLIMIRYFEKKKSVRPDIINRMLSRIEKRIEEEERSLEWERTKGALTEYVKYRELTKPFRKEVHAPDSSRPERRQYPIHGRFVYMTEEEHANYQEQEAENLQEERRWLIERDRQRAIESSN